MTSKLSIEETAATVLTLTSNAENIKTRDRVLELARKRVKTDITFQCK